MLALTGCATVAHQTETLLKTPLLGLQRSSEIPDVPFINQNRWLLWPRYLNNGYELEWSKHFG